MNFLEKSFESFGVWAVDFVEFTSRQTKTNRKAKSGPKVRVRDQLVKSNLLLLFN